MEINALIWEETCYCSYITQTDTKIPFDQSGMDQKEVRYHEL